MPIHNPQPAHAAWDGQEIALFYEDAASWEQAASASQTPPHNTPYYELRLVLRGSYVLLTERGQLSLIPGDALLLAPDRPRTCRPQPGAQSCVCRFAPSVLSGEVAAALQDMVYWSIPQGSAARERLRALRAFENEARAAGNTALLHLNTAMQQGLIHLSREQTENLCLLLRGIEQEQRTQPFGAVQMKRLLLQELLLNLRRIQLSQYQTVSRETSWKEDMVGKTLTQIDRDLTQEVDFEAIAHAQGITPAYFRTVFKEITGMTPTDYLNRVRIQRALELLQTSDAPVSEIGRKVGINDANYFSRLFKKVTGYPPRYFKAIPPNGGG